VTSPPLSYQNNVKFFPIASPPNQNFWLRQFAEGSFYSKIISYIIALVYIVPMKLIYSFIYFKAKVLIIQKFKIHVKAVTHKNKNRN